MKKLLLLVFIIPILSFCQEPSWPPEGYGLPKKTQHETPPVDQVIDFAVVESVPIFPGCKASKKTTLLQRRDEDMECLNRGIMEHIKKNFQYPQISKEMGIQEKIWVRFTVDKTGSITNVEVVRGEDPYLKEEAIRLVKIIPKMTTPATQRGKPVAVTYTTSIHFKLQ
tara:strand:- start:928 stop:1431 length:504 start_codon:yes stop_codon:yes gene_type:complete